MERRDWVTEVGATGEMPVEVGGDGTAEFLLGFADHARIVSYETPAGVDLRPGDVCILRAAVTDVDERETPAAVSVEVTDVEFVRRGSEVEAMMAHLDEAREANADRDEGCENCRPVGPDTRLSAEERVGGRDLHYCSNCDRLLSAEEYDRWKRVRR